MIFEKGENIGIFTKEKALTKCKCFFLEFGGYILSRAVSSQVPSA